MTWPLLTNCVFKGAIAGGALVQQAHLLQSLQRSRHAYSTTSFERRPNPTSKRWWDVTSGPSVYKSARVSDDVSGTKVSDEVSGTNGCTNLKGLCISDAVFGTKMYCASEDVSGMYNRCVDTPANITRGRFCEPSTLREGGACRGCGCGCGCG